VGYTDTGLTNGATYYYEVSGENLMGEGPRSSQISATPVAPQPVPSLPISWWQQYWYLILIAVAAAVTSGVLVLRKLRRERIGSRSG